LATCTLAVLVENGDSVAVSFAMAMAIRAVVCRGLWLSINLIAEPAIKAVVCRGMEDDAERAEGAVRSAGRGFSFSLG